MQKQPGEAFRHDTVKAGEFVLDYAEAGPADAPVTIVSLPGSAGLEMSRAKDELAQRHRLIEINPPGWAGKDDLDRPITTSELGALLAEAIGSLVTGEFFLIGTSMGGANALEVAAVLSDRVRGIVLEGSMAPTQDADHHIPPAQILAAAKTLDAPPPGAPSDYPLPPTHPKKPWATPEFVMRQMQNRFKMMRLTEVNMMPEPALTVIKEHSIPVLALLGDHDEVLKPSQAQTYAAILPYAQFTIIADGEHDLQNTATGDFVAHVEKFLAAPSGATTD